MAAANPRSNNAAAVDAAFLNCARRELAQQDKQLNDNYRQAINNLDDAGKKRLQEIQRAWLKVRDDNCQFLSTIGVFSDVMREYERTRCVMEWTADRSKEIGNAFYSG
jgi:uncharacterized protein YecT (DUF1311 family)